ncbi:hypothetical protein HA402_009920 [Bradysia odoriphaga]|nr:hypothetical protein HA402_009920 [Bradysia odoriphaga]
MIAIKVSTKCSDILREALKFTWLEFVERTTIHGLRYILDEQGNKFTRTLWLIVTVVGFIASNVLVDTFWLRYKANPTRLKVDSFHKPLNMLDLPAITICNGQLIDEDRARKFIDELILPSNVSKTDLLKYLAQVSAFTSNDFYNDHEMSILQTILNDNDMSVATTMEAIQTPCKDLLVRCRFEYQMRPCMELFQDSLTYLGICCTFNARDNFLHTQDFGRRGGLTVMIQPTRNSIHSKSYSREVKLLVHKSIDFPSDLSVVEMLSHQSENNVHIYPSITKCSSAVQALSFDERDCILSTEKHLRVFQKYTENNCNVECRAGQIIRLCGCLPYNYRLNSRSSKKSLSYYNNLTHIFHPFSDGLNDSHLIARISFGKQVYRELRRDLLINIITLACNYDTSYVYDRKIIFN